MILDIHTAMESTPVRPIHSIRSVFRATLDLPAPVPVLVSLIQASLPAGYPLPAQDLRVPRLEKMQLFGSDCDSAYPDISPSEGQPLKAWGLVAAALKLFPRPAQRQGIR